MLGVAPSATSAPAKDDVDVFSCVRELAERVQHGVVEAGFVYCPDPAIRAAAHDVCRRIGVQSVGVNDPRFPEALYFRCPTTKLWTPAERWEDLDWDEPWFGGECYKCPSCTDEDGYDNYHYHPEWELGCEDCTSGTCTEHLKPSVGHNGVHVYSGVRMHVCKARRRRRNRRVRAAAAAVVV